jgi:hypothetical protein
MTVECEKKTYSLGVKQVRHGQRLETNADQKIIVCVPIYYSKYYKRAKLHFIQVQVVCLAPWIVECRNSSLVGLPRPGCVAGLLKPKVRPPLSYNNIILVVVVLFYLQAHCTFLVVYLALIHDRVGPLKGSLAVGKIVLARDYHTITDRS